MHHIQEFLCVLRRHTNNVPTLASWVLAHNHLNYVGLSIH